MTTVDEWWYALAQLAASMDGRCLQDLESRDGEWPSDEAKSLFSDYIDRGVAAYDVLAPHGDRPPIGIGMALRH